MFGNNYVLDVYIEKINLLKQVCCIHHENSETCVSFAFAEKVAFDITQMNDTTQSGHKCPCIAIFKKGKSCMFPTENDFTKNTKEFKLKVEIYQRIFCATLPPKLPLGAVDIDLTEEFKSLDHGEATKQIQGNYTALSDKNEEVAILSLVVRVTKLKQIVLNDFTMSDDGMNFILKEETDKASYLCRRTCLPKENDEHKKQFHGDKCPHD